MSNKDDENTIVCRCEDVTLKEVKDLIKQGFKTVDEIKRISRSGMGPCQGRTCRQIIMREIAKATGKNIRDVKISTFRPPTKNIKMGILAQGTKGGKDEEKR